MLGALFASLVLAGTAIAITLRAGDLIATGNGGFSPKTLPKYHDAPVVLYGHGRLRTVSGNLPPIIKTIVVDFDKHGHVETRGLQVCTRAKLIATTTPEARRHCPNAIIGKGFGTAIIAFPDQAPFKITAPLTGFNGPRKHGNPTVLGHAYIDVGGPTTFIVPIEIKKIHEGVYGYRVKVNIPKIVNGYGIPIAAHGRIGRKWHYKGRLLSYVNARCQNGRLQARGKFSFDDGTVLKGTIAKLCKVRR